jgi:hypothetical protein
MNKFFVWGILMIVATLTAGFAPRLDPPTKIVEPSAPRGHWVFGADNHAHYCVGPTIKLGIFNGEFRAYATKCLGAEETVPLHD